MLGSNGQRIRIWCRNACGEMCSSVRNFFGELILRKPMKTVQIEIDTHNRLRRAVTPIQMTGIGLGGIIGTGIFVLSGQAAADFAGPSVIISFVLAGIVAVLSALSMSEMSAMMSSSGSVYTYTYVALGEFLAFIIGWLSILNYVLGATVVVVNWGQYVVHLIDLISDYNVTERLVDAPVAWSESSLKFYATGNVINLPAVGITIAITILLIIGIRETAIVNLVFVVIKVVILLIFIFVGCLYVNRKNYEPFFPSNQNSFNKYGVTGMLHASTFVFFAYAGFESVTAVAQEAKKPTRTLPIALIVSLVISLLLYVGVSTVLVGLVPYQALNTPYPLTKAVIEATPFKDWLPIVLTVGAITSLTTVAIAILLTQTRIFYAMARDGLLPKIFTKVSNKTKTPWVSVLFCGLLCAIISSICPVDILGETTSISSLITYIFVHICVIVMHYTHNDMQRPFPTPFGPLLVPGVGILLCILLLISTTKATAVRCVAWLGVGVIIYIVYGFRHSKIRKSMQENLSNSVADLVPPSPPIYTIDTDKPNSEIADDEESHVSKSSYTSK